jgi:hypothetical protein
VDTLNSAAAFTKPIELGVDADVVERHDERRTTHRLDQRGCRLEIPLHLRVALEILQVARRLDKRKAVRVQRGRLG